MAYAQALVVPFTLGINFLLIARSGILGVAVAAAWANAQFNLLLLPGAIASST